MDQVLHLCHSVAHHKILHHVHKQMLGYGNRVLWVLMNNVNGLLEVVVMPTEVRLTRVGLCDQSY